MTLDEIRKISDAEIDKRITIIVEGSLNGGTWQCYSTDLNAAMSLVPQGDDNAANKFMQYFCDIVEATHEFAADDWLFRVDADKKARVICETVLLMEANTPQKGVM